MKTCIGCKCADWYRTKAGKLHPSGEGRCTYPWAMPPLPQSMHWVGRDGSPVPYGGYISRREVSADDCVYYGRK